MAIGLSTLTADPAFAAQGPVGLGTASSFAVLAGSGITNTGATTITGDVGTFPTTSETGFASVTLHGTNEHGDAVTQGAKTDLVTSYNDAAGRKPATSVPVELGGTTLLPGVYTSPTFGLTGTVTLNAQGNSNAQFIFQAGSTLISASNSRVSLINGAQACNVVWQIGSSATFDTGTKFVGNVLASTSITALTGATFQGRLLASNGAVTLDHNTITRSTCTTTPPASPSPTPSSTHTTKPSKSPAPTPSTSSTAKPRHSPSGSPSSTPVKTPGGGLATGTSSPTPTATHSAGGPHGGGSSKRHGNSPATSLPFTGLPTGPLLATAFALLAIGGVGVIAGRKRSRIER